MNYTELELYSEDDLKSAYNVCKEYMKVARQNYEFEEYWDTERMNGNYSKGIISSVVTYTNLE